MGPGRFSVGVVHRQRDQAVMVGLKATGKLA